MGKMTLTTQTNERLAKWGEQLHHKRPEAKAAATLRALSARLAEVEDDLKSVLAREAATTARYDARLSEVEKERDEWKRQALHHNKEHGKCVEELREKGLEVLSHLGQAQDAWQAQKRAERERDEARARVAAAYEEAAKLAASLGSIVDHPSVYMGGPSRNAVRIAEAFAKEIRVLVHPEETDALERVRAEERERCAKIAFTQATSAASAQHRKAIAAAIRGDKESNEDNTN